MSTLNYLGPASLAATTTVSGASATITFAPAGQACRARHLFIDVGSLSGESFLPSASGLLGMIFVTAIRVNAGPNLVSGEIPIGLFSPSGATGGFPIAELNIALDADDIVTVEILDRNTTLQQTKGYQAQLKVDSASSTAVLNSATNVIGSPCYYLGGNFTSINGAPVAPTPLATLGTGQRAIWEATIPFAGFLDYCVTFQAGNSTTPGQTYPLVFTALNVGAVPLGPGSPSVIAGFPSASPQTGITNSVNQGTGLQCRISVAAGNAVRIEVLNDNAGELIVSLGWTFVSA